MTARRLPSARGWCSRTVPGGGPSASGWRALRLEPPKLPDAISVATPASPSCHSTKAQSISRHRATVSPATAPARETCRTGKRAQIAGCKFVHVCVVRTPHLRPTSRSSRTRWGLTAAGLSAPRVLLLRCARHHCQTGHERQPRRRYRLGCLCRRLPRSGLRHLRTRPYRPRTNGKAVALDPRYLLSGRA